MKQKKVGDKILSPCFVPRSEHIPSHEKHSLAWTLSLAVGVLR